MLVQLDLQTESLTVLCTLYTTWTLPTRLLTGYTAYVHDSSYTEIRYTGAMDYIATSETGSSSTRFLFTKSFSTELGSVVKCERQLRHHRDIQGPG